MIQTIRDDHVKSTHDIIYIKIVKEGAQIMQHNQILATEDYWLIY